MIKVGYAVLQTSLSPEMYLGAFKGDPAVRYSQLANNHKATDLVAQQEALRQVDIAARIPPDVRIQLDYNFAMGILWNLTESLELNDKALAIIRSPLDPIEPYMRLCLAPQDPVVWRRFADDVRVRLNDMESNERLEFLAAISRAFGPQHEHMLMRLCRN